MRTRLILWLAGLTALVAMLLVLSAAALVTARDSRRAAASEKVSSAVRKVSMLRGMLPEPARLQRQAHQWQHQSEELRQLLLALPARGERSTSLLVRLMQEHAGIESLLDNLATSGQGDGVSILRGQLEVRTSAMLADLLTLNRLLEEEAGQARRWGLALMLGAPVALAGIVLLLLLTLERRIARPLTLLAQAADRVGAGVLEQPIRAEGTHEVRMLARSLDGMREALHERDRSRNHFMFMLSHELRNPLAPMLHSLALLDRVDPDSDIARRATEVLRRQGGQLSRLIEDLLDATRAMSGKLHVRLQPIDLRDVVREAVEDQRGDADARGVALAEEVPDRPVVVQGDGQRLAQLLANLLRNALESAPRGGHVTAALQREASTPWCELHVVDDGVGIDPALQARLFEPFVQARSSTSGLGLGLSVVRAVAHAHGGSVRVHSSGVPGEGAAFVVRLPCEPVPHRTEAFVPPAVASG